MATNDIWPSYLGEGFPQREPFHNTIVQASSSGQDEVRVATFPFPNYRWTFEYQYLGGGNAGNIDYEVFAAFFKDHAGRFYSFLLNDPDDNASTLDFPTGEQVAIGDGATKVFQCMRTHQNIQEPVYGIHSPSDVTITPGGGSVDNFGRITYGTAPGSGVAITNRFTAFYWRVRFDTDNLQFQKIAQGFWGLKQVTLVSTRQ